MEQRPDPADMDLSDEEYARHFAKSPRPSQITDPRDPAYQDEGDPICSNCGEELIEFRGRMVCGECTLPIDNNDAQGIDTHEDLAYSRTDFDNPRPISNDLDDWPF